MAKIRNVSGMNAGDKDADTNDIESTAPKFAADLISRAALRKLPEPKPLIGNVLDQGTVALLYGQWGTCKSFIGIDWAASIATGRPWQGRKTEKCRSLYVAAEGAFGLAARVDAWEYAWRIEVGDGDMEILPHPVNLTHPTEVAELTALIRWGGYGFIVVDTLSRCMVGGDENSARDCGEVVDALTRLREHTPDGRGCILGIHHTGKDGKTFRGSSVFEAGADTVYSVTADGAAIILDREKRKDGPQLDRHELQLELVPECHSGYISVHRVGGHSGSADKLLSVYVQHFGETGASKAELRHTADMANATFHRALNELLKSGKLVNTGTDKRTHYKLPQHASG
ncbi:AAA family ATPase [Mycobacterium paraffinicum]|uniref:AAA family ATPase n=1 Tax=Mycobacterium paraffinicum TaxID=53378 RepID=A0ABP8F255_9MYCO|nr:helicase RepA family protein [Mycobacterium paraffinicum]MCV7311915.1 AAA family ATPase [Mycobacterium paraffinicum]